MHARIGCQMPSLASLQWNTASMHEHGALHCRQCADRMVRDTERSAATLSVRPRVPAQRRCTSYP